MTLLKRNTIDVTLSSRPVYRAYCSVFYVSPVNDSNAVQVFVLYRSLLTYEKHCCQGGPPRKVGGLVRSFHCFYGL